MDNKRITAINTQLSRVQNEQRDFFNNNVNNYTGNVSTNLPDAYTKVLEYLSTAFNESLTSSNGLAVGGTVMDQIAIAFAPIVMMNENFSRWVFDALDPNTATGTARRVLCKLLDINPKSSAPTKILLKISGQINTVVDPLALLITTIVDVNPEQKIELYNIDTISFTTSNIVYAWFVCRKWGEVLISENNTYEIISYVTGIESIVFDKLQSEIVIGQEEDTDFNLKQQCQFSLNKLSSNGYTSIEGQLIEAIPSATGIVTLLNNTDLEKQIGDTVLPAHCVVISLSCDDSQETLSSIASVLFYNRTGLDFKYPLSIPDINKKTTTYIDHEKNITYNFNWVQTNPKKVLFFVHINANSVWYSISNTDIKEAIIQQFQQGGYQHNKVVQGVTFYLEWFNQAVSKLGLPSYNISMKFDNGVFATQLTSKIWEFPITNESLINVTWETNTK